MKEKPKTEETMYKTPDGSSVYYSGGKILRREFSDGSNEFYNEKGKIISRTGKDGKNIPVDTIPENPENTEKEEGKIKNEKKPFFTKRMVKIGALAAGLAVGGYGAQKGGEYAGKYMGEKRSDIPITEKEKDIKKESETFYKSPVTDMTAEATRLKEKAEEERVEKIKAGIQAEFDKEEAKRKISFSNELVKIKAERSAPIVTPEPVPKTHEEIMAAIEAKIMRGEKITASEASMHNLELMKRPVRVATGMPKPSGEARGVNYTYNNAPRVINPAPTQAEKTLEINPFHLKPKILEEVEEIYENKLEEIFPQDTLKVWKSVKDQSAYEWTSNPENHQEEYGSLVSFLERLKDTTSLNPRSGVRGKTESIEKYIERALQYAASKKLLDNVK